MAKIVIADDDSEVLDALVQQVKELGHDVVGTAKSGKEAYALVCTQHPDVAILDIKMSDGDGIEAARDIYESCPTPIIFLTGFADPALAEQATQTGAFAYLVKPVRLEELMTNIELVRQRFEEIRQRQTELDRAKRDLANRRILERAKGFLMDKFGMKEMDAYRIIHRAARHSRRTLGEVAQEVLESGKPPEIHE